MVDMWGDKRGCVVTEDTIGKSAVADGTGIIIILEEETGVHMGVMPLRFIFMCVCM